MPMRLAIFWIQGSGVDNDKARSRLQEVYRLSMGHAASLDVDDCRERIVPGERRIGKRSDSLKEESQCRAHAPYIIMAKTLT